MGKCLSIICSCLVLDKNLKKFNSFWIVLSKLFVLACISSIDNGMPYKANASVHVGCHSNARIVSVWLACDNSYTWLPCIAQLLSGVATNHSSSQLATCGAFSSSFLPVLLFNFLQNVVPVNILLMIVITELTL